MTDIRAALGRWSGALEGEVPIRGIIARHREAHTSTAPTRSLLIRTASAWRSHDLLTQALVLYDAGHLLGARILVRSAIESLAVLAYLNQQMRGIVAGTVPFHNFIDKTKTLALGSRNKSTEVEALNIMTILQKVEHRIPGLCSVYNALSESAHPNHEGLINGYLTFEDNGWIAKFSNRWAEIYSDGFESYVLVVAQLFYIEHDLEWSESFADLERWLATNPQPTS